MNARARRTAWSSVDTLAVAATTVVAAAVRAVGMTTPDELVFDRE